VREKPTKTRSTIAVVNEAKTRSSDCRRVAMRPEGVVAFVTIMIRFCELWPVP
jgi:hypothetical protein